MDFNNLEELLEHESLLQVLSRTVAEHGSKSLELALHALCVFYVISNYRQFVKFLTDNQVGKTVLELINHQVQRFDLLYSEYLETWRKNDETEKLTAKNQLKKLNVLIWKQDKLFFIVLNILLNISDDPTVEKKMKKADITRLLIRCLERNDLQLLVVALYFLKKLSVINSYKDEMIQLSIVEKLQRFFTCENDNLINLMLELYYNLSFDKQAREAIEKANLIPKFVKILSENGPLRGTAVSILYLLSTDQNIRFTLAYTNCFDYAMKLILFPGKDINAAEILGLAINLSTNQRNVEHLS